jgi:hypothetical protein
MSDNWLQFVPRDPTYRPSREAAEATRLLLSSFLHRRPLRHGRAPAQQVRVLLARLDLDHARKVHRHHGGDVGHAEAVGGDEVAASQAFVQRGKELLHPRQPALGQRRDLRVVHRARQRAVGHGRRAVAQGLGNGQQAFELHAPVPAGDLGLLRRASPSSGGSG